MYVLVYWILKRNLAGIAFVELACSSPPLEALEFPDIQSGKAVPRWGSNLGKFLVPELSDSMTDLSGFLIQKPATRLFTSALLTNFLS